ncbi:MAG: hypothetical protein Q9208_007827 [Pyrenodesmia sp. 3 TL-2023]
MSDQDRPQLPNRFDPRDLTQQFEQLLRTRRLNALTERSRVYGEAEDESQLLQAQAASIGPHVKPEWGYQDCVIRALLRPEEEDAANGPIASVCYVEQSVAESDGSGTLKTTRYVRDAAKHGLDRNRCPEEVLVWITDDIKKMRRENTAKEDRRRLVIEDHREEKELRGYVVQALAAQIGQINLSGQPSTTGEEQKLPERVSGSRAWREARGEAGNHPSSDNERPPREGQ